MDTENKVSETVDTEVKTVSTNSSDHSLDYDALASEIGWSPKEKFRGDPAKWVDAKTYYEKGEFVLPIVKKQREEAKKDAESLRKQLAELKSAQAEFQKFTEAAAERKYKDELSELKQLRAAAVAAGDDKAFKQADDAIDDLKEAVGILSAENDRLNQRLAVEAMDASEDEKLSASVLIEELQAQVKSLSAELRAVKSSRDALMTENAAMKRQLMANLRATRKAANE